MPPKVPLHLTSVVAEPPAARPASADAAGGDPLMGLVAAAAGGDRASLMRLLALVAPPVTATVRVFLGRGHGDLEDVVQEVLIAVTDALPRFRGESSFVHYCRRIAVRMALAHRRARRHALLAAPDAYAAGPAPDGDGVERAQRLQAFRQLLDELPPGQAESLAYRVILDAPLPAIARETGVPVNTVRSRIRLAREHLRARLNADPELLALLRSDP